MELSWLSVVLIGVAATVGVELIKAVWARVSAASDKAVDALMPTPEEPVKPGESQLVQEIQRVLGAHAQTVQEHVTRIQASLDALKEHLKG